jgi:hypothetical protein
MIYSNYFLLCFTNIGQPLPGMPGSTVGPVPIIRMYGITMAGNSVLAHIHGFPPYFYVTAPLNFKPDDCKRFKVSLGQGNICPKNGKFCERGNSLPVYGNFMKKNLQ